MNFLAIVAAGTLLAPTWTWTDISPGNDVTLVAAHAMEPARLFAMVGIGQAYSSIDGGATWKGGFVSPRDGALVHSGRPGRIFSQERFAYQIRLGSLSGGGLFFSDDFGASWTSLRGRNDMTSPPSAVLPFGSDPDDPQRLYGTTRPAINCGHTNFGGFVCELVRNTGVVKSPDGGRTWVSASLGLPAGNGQPTPPTATARGRLFYALPTGVFVSRDSARTWQPLPGAPVMEWIKADPLRSNVLYAFRRVASNSINPGEVLKSIDEGATWTTIRREGLLARDVRPELVLDPANGDRLWLAGLAEGVLFSRDGGSTWEPRGLPGVQDPACSAGLACGAYRIRPASIATRITLSAAEPEVVYVLRDGRLLVGDFRTDDARPAVEFYNQGEDRYWLTANAGEAQAVDFSLPDWQRTGEAFGVWNQARENRYSACKFQGVPRAGQHSRFITLAGYECDSTKSWSGMVLEDERGFYAYAPTGDDGCGGVRLEVRRFYNGKDDVNHRYVVGGESAQAMRARGWLDEGVVMCAAPPS